MRERESSRTERFDSSDCWLCCACFQTASLSFVMSSGPIAAASSSSSAAAAAGASAPKPSSARYAKKTQPREHVSAAAAASSTARADPDSNSDYDEIPTPQLATRTPPSAEDVRLFAASSPVLLSPKSDVRRMRESLAVIREEFKLVLKNMEKVESMLMSSFPETTEDNFEPYGPLSGQRCCEEVTWHSSDDSCPQLMSMR